MHPAAFGSALVRAPTADAVETGSSSTHTEKNWMRLKKSFLMDRGEPVLPTGQITALRAQIEEARGASDTPPRKPLDPAGETGAGVVPVWVTPAIGAARDAVSPCPPRAGHTMTSEPTTTALSADQTAPAEPGSVRTKPPKPPRTRRRTWKQFFQALSMLALVLGVALGSLLLGGVLLHHFVPGRHVDIFAAVHNHIVLGVLFGLSALWLLPPYPWATQPPSVESLEPAQSAGETERGDTSVTALSQFGVGSRLAGPIAQEG